MRLFTAFLLVTTVCGAAMAQDQLPTMPRYERYTRLSKEMAGSVVNGSATVTWNEDGKSFFYSHGGKRYKYDVDAKKAAETTEEPKAPVTPRRGRRGGDGQPERGRQFA